MYNQGLFEESEQECKNLPNPHEPEIQHGLDGLFELSVDAYYSALHAAMSELPIRKEIERFIVKTIAAGGKGNRTAAAMAASDRGDPDVLTVLKAAGKVQHEIHRMCGLLRFSPAPGGTYIARCEPDHFILPALAEHFTLRFGETPWAIIDEKRGLCLLKEKDKEARLGPTPTEFSSIEAKGESDDSWEDFWRLYHRSIIIEERKNLKLQRQFIPERYHKYLTELRKQ
jgi:probable DNA metabolism protein